MNDAPRRPAPAGDVDYAIHGDGYATRRGPDPRIDRAIVEQLGDARTVLNVGAGTGSYEPRDRYLVAVEPSAAMRAQRPPDAVPAIDAHAENLPFDDEAFDAAMALVTVHQWKDLSRGLGELRRVTRGPVVVMCFDNEALDGFWLARYVPELIAVNRARDPAIDVVAAGLGGAITVIPVAIPIDCVDGVQEAFYGRPEAFLDAAVRRSQSAWTFVSEAVVGRFVDHLSRDLADGTWDRAYGALRTQPTYDGSLRLVVSRPGPDTP